MSLKRHRHRIRHDNLSQDVDLAAAMPALIAAGFPTFDEFRKNPDKWRKRPDDILASADLSTQAFRDNVKRQRYFWRDKYELDSLEGIEKICAEEGFNKGELEMEPRVRQTNEGKVEICVHFWPPNEWAAMGRVSTNG